MATREELDLVKQKTQPVGDPIPETLPDPIAPPAALAPAPKPKLPDTAVQPGGGFNYGGYDFQQDAANRDPRKSAKYALAAILENSGAPMPKTHAEAEAFARQYLVPGFQQYGYNIRDIDRDRFTIDTRENDAEIIDWLVNAGGENPNIGWQSNVGSSSGANAGLVDPVSSLRGMPGGSDILQGLMGENGLGGSDLMRRIQAELQKLLSGQAASSPEVPAGGGNPFVDVGI